MEKAKRSGVPAKAGNQTGNQNTIKHGFYPKAWNLNQPHLNNKIMGFLLNCFPDIMLIFSFKKREKPGIVFVKKSFYFFYS